MLETEERIETAFCIFPHFNCPIIVYVSYLCSRISKKNGLPVVMFTSPFVFFKKFMFIACPGVNSFKNCLKKSHTF